jgi:hypothetical protein
MKMDTVNQKNEIIIQFCYCRNTHINYMQGFFTGKRGAGTQKRGKDKHTESCVTILL